MTRNNSNSDGKHVSAPSAVADLVGFSPSSSSPRRLGCREARHHLSICCGPGAPLGTGHSPSTSCAQEPSSFLPLVAEEFPKATMILVLQMATQQSSEEPSHGQKREMSALQHSGPSLRVPGPQRVSYKLTRLRRQTSPGETGNLP